MNVRSTLPAIEIFLLAVSVGFLARPDLSQADLYDAAKSEKQALLYTSLNIEDAEKLTAAFAKKYPGVNVTVNRQSANTVLQKVLT